MLSLRLVVFIAILSSTLAWVLFLAVLALVLAWVLEPASSHIGSLALTLVLESISLAWILSLALAWVLTLLIRVLLVWVLTILTLIGRSLLASLFLSLTSAACSFWVSRIAGITLIILSGVISVFLILVIILASFKALTTFCKTIY